MIFQLFFLTTPHFWLMFTAIIISGIGVLFAIQKKPKKVWYPIHRILTAITLILAIIAMLIVNGPQFQSIHPIIGFLAIILLILELFLGIYIYLKKKPKYRKIHIWTGRVIGILLIGAMVLGIISYF